MFRAVSSAALASIVSAVCLQTKRAEPNTTMVCVRSFSRRIRSVFCSSSWNRTPRTSGRSRNSWSAKASLYESLASWSDCGCVCCVTNSAAVSALSSGILETILYLYLPEKLSCPVVNDYTVSFCPNILKKHIVRIRIQGISQTENRVQRWNS